MPQRGDFHKDNNKNLLQNTQCAGRTLVVQYVASGLCRRKVRGFMYFIASFNDAVIYSGYTRVGTLIVATIYLQLIQNRYMFRSFTVRQCSHQHCVQPVTSDVEVVGYL